MLPGMLDKLKDKTTLVIMRIQEALLHFVNYCFALSDVTAGAYTRSR
jgi:cytoskeleton-associated protein 5